MPARLSFIKHNRKDSATALSEVEIVTLEDYTGNQYTLDITTGNLKVKYTPRNGNTAEYTVNSLASALGKLLSVKSDTPGKSVLAKEVAKQPVVDAITASSDFTGKVYTKITADGKFATIIALNSKADTTALADKVNTADTYTKTVADGKFATITALSSKADTADVYTKTDANTTFLKTGEFATKVTEKAVAGAILGAKDGKKSILADELGKVLGDTTNKAKYEGSNEQTAKVFLESKGLTPPVNELADKLVKVPEFIQAVKTDVDFKGKDLQGAVREVMSQPIFEIPADENSPLSWDWI